MAPRLLRPVLDDYLILAFDEAAGVLVRCDMP
jgi:hypothetical protein